MQQNNVSAAARLIKKHDLVDNFDVVRVFESQYAERNMDVALKIAQLFPKQITIQQTAVKQCIENEMFVEALQLMKLGGLQMVGTHTTFDVICKAAAKGFPSVEVAVEVPCYLYIGPNSV